MDEMIQRNPAIIALKKQARKLGTPLFGAFELTNKCNLDCKMCYVHNEHSKNNTLDISFETLTHLFDAAYDNGMMFALLTGGECLLRKDFKNIYSYLYDKGVIMSINSNGTLLTEEYIEFFSKKRPERIQISLYGSNDDAYEHVTGQRVFQKVDHAITMLLEAGLPVEIAVTPSVFMYNDYANVIQYIKSKNLFYRRSEFLLPPREGTCVACELSFEQKMELLLEEQKITEKPIYCMKNDAPDTGSMQQVEPVLGMPCNAGTIRFSIDYKGYMIPCMSIADIRINALKNDFKTCWDYIRQRMAEVKQPAECKECFYKKSCPSCPSIRYPDLFSGNPNRVLCEYSKLKYKMGLIPDEKPHSD